MGSFIIIFVYFLCVSDIMAKYSNLSSVLNIFTLVSCNAAWILLFDSTYVNHFLASYKSVNKCNTYIFNQNCFLSLGIVYQILYR